MNQQEMEACKARIKEFINVSTDEQFDGLVAEANKLGFRELSRKLMIVWVAGAECKDPETLGTSLVCPKCGNNEWGQHRIVPMENSTLLCMKCKHSFQG